VLVGFAVWGPWADERKIEDIRRRGRLPILVGGTHYYVQSLLFPHSSELKEEKEEGEGKYAFPPVDVKLAEKYSILWVSSFGIRERH
jgi:tRNA dimethylallyltransferase